MYMIELFRIANVRTYLSPTQGTGTVKLSWGSAKINISWKKMGLKEDNFLTIFPPFGYVFNFGAWLHGS